MENKHQPRARGVSEFGGMPSRAPSFERSPLKGARCCVGGLNYGLNTRVTELVKLYDIAMVDISNYMYWNSIIRGFPFPFFPFSFLYFVTTMLLSTNFQNIDEFKIIFSSRPRSDSQSKNSKFVKNLKLPYSI